MNEPLKATAERTPSVRYSARRVMIAANTSVPSASNWMRPRLSSLRNRSTTRITQAMTNTHSSGAASNMLELFTYNPPASGSFDC